MFKFKPKAITFTPEQDANLHLSVMQAKLVSDPQIHQVELNIASDRLRLYLGESSKIYLSFAAIDISIQDGKRAERIQNAIRLLGAAIDSIALFGLYEDLQTQLLRLNIQDVKHKNKITVFTAFGGILIGAILTNAKDIIAFLHLLLQSKSK